MNTSRTAFGRISRAAGAMREEILDHITAVGPRTCDEIEAELGYRHQTASARITELKKSGELVDTGIRRATRSGAQAVVLKLGHVHGVKT